MTTAISATDKAAQDAIYAAAGLAQAKPKTNATATTGQSSLGQKDFVRLMTAQLQYQDPFNPQDNTQMVAQMATFSQVAGISEMSSTLAGIASRLGTTTAGDAMSFVGRTVLTEGKTAYERTAGGIMGGVELANSASDVDVTITDKNGMAVKNIQLGKQDAGTVDFTWDGKDAAGNKVENGPYTVTVEAANGSTIVEAKPLVWAPVETVSLVAGGEPVLNVTGLGKVDPAAVRKVA
ncbi:flagellar basal-body rod modification protein FlgD [Sphingomonas sp. BE138]|uniref:flagellar hook assembly protein FlgD n=1 Tax=Sphingomonas sp. BE138 TaxID=2817845 RepID=UPI00286474C3|nr:flagellar hook assembly protein FlgD [Sphingomonas sp. BE138]MDR6788959.1 flagellar basal-body rod modification protein FlgD [Sphingomonas sp. BE138]